MTSYDLFNGDADGICALHQWRMAHPAESERITGVKRDIHLLERISPAAGDECWVFDISLDSNRVALDSALTAGVKVTWFDHHFAGELPTANGFVGHIDTHADICTSLIVNDLLGGRFAEWATVAAYGDNLHHVAAHLARSAGHSDSQAAALAELGELINYNAYGNTVDDLHVNPLAMYESVAGFGRPQDFIVQSPTFVKLKNGFLADCAQADSLRPFHESTRAVAYLLPDEAWARRIIGVMANRLAMASPERAHALLVPAAPGYLTISVRAPKANPEGADSLCRQFPNGGGRKAAAGINAFPVDEIDRFINALACQYS